MDADAGTLVAAQVSVQLACLHRHGCVRGTCRLAVCRQVCQGVVQQTDDFDSAQVPDVRMDWHCRNDGRVGDCVESV